MNTFVKGYFCKQIPLSSLHNPIFSFTIERDVDSGDEQEDDKVPNEDALPRIADETLIFDAKFTYC